MGSVFKFKSFEVDQTGCAMKINTDGVLLGAIVAAQQPLHILDIGTGTGVIALMLAQRFTGAYIDAVEIDDIAAGTAARNFAASPFAQRTAVHAIPFEQFASGTSYDLVVSNPPYFVNDLKNPEKKKEIARHTHEDFFELLLRRVVNMLSKAGAVWLILPVKQAEKLIIDAVLYQLYPARIIHVCSDQDKPAFRLIICLDFNPANVPVTDHLYIYESQGRYTDQYKTLLKDFLLAF